MRMQLGENVIAEIITKNVYIFIIWSTEIFYRKHQKRRSPYINKWFKWYYKNLTKIAYTFKYLSRSRTWIENGNLRQITAIVLIIKFLGKSVENSRKFEISECIGTDIFGLLIKNWNFRWLKHDRKIKEHFTERFNLKEMYFLWIIKRKN